MGSRFNQDSYGSAAAHDRPSTQSGIHFPDRDACFFDSSKRSTHMEIKSNDQLQKKPDPAITGEFEPFLANTKADIGVPVHSVQEVPF